MTSLRRSTMDDDSFASVPRLSFSVYFFNSTSAFEVPTALSTYCLVFDFRSARRMLLAKGNNRLFGVFSAARIPEWKEQFIASCKIIPHVLLCFQSVVHPHTYSSTHQSDGCVWISRFNCVIRKQKLTYLTWCWSPVQSTLARPHQATETRMGRFWRSRAKRQQSRLMLWRQQFGWVFCMCCRLYNKKE